MSFWKVVIFLGVPLALPHRLVLPPHHVHDQKDSQSRPQPVLQTVVVQPGDHNGWAFDGKTGEILQIAPGSQADQLGLEAGQYITKVDEQPFNQVRMKRTLLRSELTSSSFQLTVQTPSHLSRTVKTLLWTLSWIVGLIGLMFAVSLPCMIYSATYSGFRSSGTNQILSHPVVKALVAAQTVCILGIQVAEWPYSDFPSKAQRLGDAACVAGIIMGCVYNEKNPLLNTALHDENQKLLQKLQWIGWTLCSISVKCCVAHSVLLHCPVSFHSGRFQLDLYRSQQLLFNVSGVLSNFSMVLLTCLVSNICVAASQQMNDIAAKLPCKAKEFEEQVHRPCADLLQRSPSQLSTCGWPLVLVTLGALASLGPIYRDLTDVFAIEQGPILADAWLSLVRTSSSMAARLWPLSGVFLLSSAKQRLHRGLEETRQSDPTLHLLVEGVEAMLDKVNDGHGWGIPVSRSLVLRIR